MIPLSITLPSSLAPAVEDKVRADMAELGATGERLGDETIYRIPFFAPVRRSRYMAFTKVRTRRDGGAIVVQLFPTRTLVCALVLIAVLAGALAFGKGGGLQAHAGDFAIFAPLALLLFGVQTAVSYFSVRHWLTRPPSPAA